MVATERVRASLVFAAAVVLLGIVAAIYMPTWWEQKLYREAEALTGVGSAILPGSVTDARRGVDVGKSGADVQAAIGKPSFATASEGASKHEIWKYYYSDGTMIINVTDGYVARVALEFGPPKIPTSRRPAR